MQEKWKSIPNFPNYAVSNFGNVLSVDKDLVMAQHLNNMGIPYVRFSERGEPRIRSVAPMVADAFLQPHSNPRCDTPINLDGDRRNNHVDNLALRPRWFVVKYHQQFKPKFFYRHPGKLIYCLEDDQVYQDPMHAAVKYGLLVDRMIEAIYNNTTTFPDNVRFEFFEYMD